MNYLSFLFFTATSTTLMDSLIDCPCPQSFFSILLFTQLSYLFSPIIGDLIAPLSSKTCLKKCILNPSYEHQSSCDPMTSPTSTNMLCTHCVHHQGHLPFLERTTVTSLVPFLGWVPYKLSQKPSCENDLLKDLLRRMEMLYNIEYFVLSNVHLLKPNLSCDGIRRWDLQSDQILRVDPE